MPRFTQGIVLALTGVLLGTPTARAQMTFTALGGLSETLSGDSLNYLSLTYGVSGDGRVVTGMSINNSGIVEAFRWTPTLGMVGIGNLGNGNLTSLGIDVSYDGTTIVGMSPWANGDRQISEAFRWRSSGGMVGLGHQIGTEAPNLGPYTAPFSASVGVSDDGSIVVGTASSKNGPLEAFRWTEATGMMEGLGDLPEGDFYSVARTTSGDGKVVVGESRSGKDANEGHTEAFRWTEATGMMEGLGNLGGATFDSVAYDVSRDGNVIVGRGESASGTEAFRWTQSDGMVGLDTQHIFSLSAAISVSGDGRIVVGHANTPIGGQPDSNSKAFVWTESHGMRDLSDILTEGGINLGSEGWTSLFEIEEISADGTTLVGNGFRTGGYREAFVIHDPNRFGLGAASAPEPATLSLFPIVVLPLLTMFHRRRRCELAQSQAIRHA